MKNIIMLLGGIIFLAASTVCFAKPGGGNSGNVPKPNQSAYDHANANAKFKRGEDWSAGKKVKEHTDKAKDKADKVKAKEQKAAKKAEHKAKKAQDKVKDAADDVKDATQDAVDSVTQ